jgi:hypothetical protein
MVIRFCCIFTVKRKFTAKTVHDLASFFFNFNLMISVEKKTFCTQLHGHQLTPSKWVTALRSENSLFPMKKIQYLKYMWKEMHFF